MPVGSVAMAGDEPDPEAPYLAPPGTLWGWLGPEHGAAESIITLPDGYLVAGNQVNPDPEAPPPASWGVLIRLGLEAEVLAQTNYLAEEDHNWIRQVVATFRPDGSPAAFAFVGEKHVRTPDPVDPRAEWYVPWLWVARLTPGFETVWETSVGESSHQTEGWSLVWDGADLLAGGSDFPAPGMTSSAHEWLVRLSAGGVVTAQVAYGFDGDGGIRGVHRAQGGGYLLATTKGVLKVDTALEQEWRAADSPPAPGWLPDRFEAVAQGADGAIYAAGRRQAICEGGECSSDLVLVKLTPDGVTEWTVVVGLEGTEDHASDVVALEDGGCAVAGATSSFGHGGADAWVLRFSADGELLWDLPLGGPGHDSAHALTVAPDGALVMAGQAQVEGTRRWWVVKLSPEITAPVPVFAMDPESPVFRDEEVRFDASGSSAPGSTIRRIEWRFGDGTPAETGTNVVHAYHAKGRYEAVLTVENAEGVRRSVTNVVEVVPAAIQWQRFLGEQPADTVNSLVEAADGGLILTGKKADEFWVFKLDRRGRLVWEQLFPGGESGEGEGRVVIHGTDGGYVVTGSDFYHHSGWWRHDAWLMKLDEDGALAWPEVRTFGNLVRDEQGWCVAPMADGGYILAIDRYSPDGASHHPWLIKTDVNGVEEWNVEYDPGYSAQPVWVVGTPDGGFAFTTDAGVMPFPVVR
ncbi:MAG: PKD domain-containing protein, partial [Verrucomicrobia bacterium]